MSRSWADAVSAVARWRRQRLPHGIFLPGAALLVLASAVGLDLPLWEGLRRFGLAWVLLFAFRLWDDLEDRAVDREQHPERVHTEPAWVRLFAGIVVMGLILSLPATFSLGAAVVLLALIGGLGLVYRTGAPRALVLLKYPVIAGLLRAEVDLGVALGMATLLAAMAADEALDGRVRPLIRRPILLIITGIVLLVLHLGLRQ